MCRMKCCGISIVSFHIHCETLQPGSVNIETWPSLLWRCWLGITASTCTCTCTCGWWAVEALALEQADIFVVIQPILELVDWRWFHSVLRQGVPVVLHDVKAAVSLVQLLNCRSESVKRKNVSLLTFSFPNSILYVSGRSRLILHLLSVVNPRTRNLYKYSLPSCL